MPITLLFLFSRSRPSSFLVPTRQPRRLPARRWADHAASPHLQERCRRYPCGCSTAVSPRGAHDARDRTQLTRTPSGTGVRARSPSRAGCCKTGHRRRGCGALQSRSPRAAVGRSRMDRPTDRRSSTGVLMPHTLSQLETNPEIMSHIFKTSIQPLLAYGIKCIFQYIWHSLI